MSKLIAGGNTKRQRIVDVLNEFCGCHYKGYQRGDWSAPESTYAFWFPKVSGLGQRRKDSDWLNVLDARRGEITAEWVGETSEAQSRESFARRYADKLQVVFANFVPRKGYEFIGVYKLRHSNDGKRHYSRVSDRCDTAMF